MFPSYYGPSRGLPVRKINDGYPLVNPSPLTNQYNLFNSGVQEDAQNRDELWKGYKDFGTRFTNNLSSRGTMVPGKYTPGSYTPLPYRPPTAFNPTGYSNPGNFEPESYGSPEQFKPTTLGKPEAYNPAAIGKPQLFNPDSYSSPQLFNPENINSPELYHPGNYDYKRSNDFTDAIENLKGLTESGGYSAGDINNLRERGISPIRSIYANATRDIDRGRVLSGSSTSAGYTAAKSRMARELADKIGGITTDVNANIAENVARNKVSLAPVYAGVTGNESALANTYGKANVDEQNRAALINSGFINDVNRTNVEGRNRASLFNIGNLNDISRLNTDEQNKSKLFNINNLNDIDKMNVMEQNKANLFNTENINNTNRENTGILNSAGQLNTDLINRILQMNTGLKNDVGRFNFTNKQDISRANTDLFNKFGSKSVDEENDTNRLNTDETNKSRLFNVTNDNEGRRINFELPFRMNDINNQNRMFENQDNENLFRSLEGMRSLFGTTPALSQLFGNQALSFSGQQSNINQQNQNRGMELIAELLKRFGSRN